MSASAQLAKRFALLVVAFTLISVALVACQAPAASQAGTNPIAASGSGGNAFRTPVPPTPVKDFPPFTVGAWPSSYSPGNVDTLTIYVLCRIQDQTMNTPPTPAAGLTVNVIFDTGQNGSGVTDASGLATVVFSINDPNSGTPVRVTISTNYKGVEYHAETFFTPSPLVRPSPTAGASGTPGATPTH